MSRLSESSNDQALEQARSWMIGFERALSSFDYERLASECFEPKGFWRDLLAFTWNIKTLEGPESIQQMLDAVAPKIAASNFTISSATFNDK